LKQALEQFALAEGDILINRVNSPKFLGKSALVQGMPELSVYESNMMRLRLDGSRVKQGYAVLYLRSTGGLEELRKNAKHAVNQSSINQEDVKGVLFALPPLSEQKEIVRRVEGMFALPTSRRMRSDARR
jgi:type I restriction enzyme, S subunit